MIVTHEMAFAQSICNRVFYMDNAGIYEDGSPEQIFDHPIHDRTRQFVRRLKVLELEIKSRDYDFRGVVGQIDQYCRKNHVDSKLTYRIQLCFEEVVQEILLKNIEDPLINAVVEYSEAEEKVTMIMRFNGPELDEFSINSELSFAMLKRIVRKFNYDRIDSEDYSNRFVFEIDNKSVSR